MRIPAGADLLQRVQIECLDIGGLRVNFQRTCRVPAGVVNSLPAGLGSFPVFRVSDFKAGAPDEWREDGYFMPMYRQEAMWISFARGYMENPKALIVGAGNINAVSGVPFSSPGEETLDIKLEPKQNYLVVPPQPWLDGWKAEDGKIYQFVAAELGSGETVEGQITGKETVGGIQLIVYDPKEGQSLTHATRPHEYMVGGSWSPALKGSLLMEDYGLESVMMASAKSPARLRGMSVQSMGLGRGGEIQQKIYPDPHGLDVWQEKPTAVEMVYLVSSEDFRQVTGYNAPPTPVTHEKYQQMGLPWFELHDAKLGDSAGSDIFAKLKPVGEGKAQNTGYDTQSTPAEECLKTWLPLVVPLI